MVANNDGDLAKVANDGTDGLSHVVPPRFYLWFPTMPGLLFRAFRAVTSGPSSGGSVLSNHFPVQLQGAFLGGSVPDGA